MMYRNPSALLLLLFYLAAASEVNIQRHAVVDDKASSKLMRQELQQSKKHIHGQDESDQSGEDDDISKAEDLLKQSDDQSKKADAILKHSSDEMLNEADKAIFKEADADQSGSLDEDEMSKVLNKAGLTQSEFDWHAHDHDQDGKLSEAEFLEAGRAAGHNAPPRSISLLEEYVVSSGGPARLMKLKDFKTYDSDGSGALEEPEAKNVMKGLGLKEDSWRKFDMDGDGKLSESEFNKDRAAFTKDTMSENPGVDRDHAVFQHADTDSSSFLEESEVNFLLNQVPALHGHPFDWRKFDYDKDGRLSEPEFMRAGPAVLKAAQDLAPKANATSPMSFAQESAEEYEEDEDSDEEEHEEEQEDEHEDENEDEESHKADDADVARHVKEDFKLADKDHDGLLDEHEMEAFGKEAQFPPHFDWKTADANRDGKLNEEELFNLARFSRQDEKHDPNAEVEDEEDDEEDTHELTGKN
eukprot:gnl/MRDRNA2_/MRDRNA2_90799_c0_seq1.p1 gnl/MRDRNA2_/MRDRNA2_90799_c0~~gnl/MRDRNA2_/MRDRNA2_90799_c0_seq1.p1  ORF type:complete len:470 (+),score=160.52 gnl/MRDRNA2_/MRDRNA2_90799_c0_seq1:76-1485(+)